MKTQFLKAYSKTCPGRQYSWVDMIHSTSLTRPSKELATSFPRILSTMLRVNSTEMLSSSIGYSKGTVIQHNEIFNLTYSGISIGWGWSREVETYAQDNIVAGNKIHDFKLQKSLPWGVSRDGGGYTHLDPNKFHNARKLGV